LPKTVDVWDEGGETVVSVRHTDGTGATLRIDPVWRGNDPRRASAAAIYQQRAKRASRPIDAAEVDAIIEIADSLPATLPAAVAYYLERRRQRGADIFERRADAPGELAEADQDSDGVATVGGGDRRGHADAAPPDGAEVGRESDMAGPVAGPSHHSRRQERHLFADG
jgi:hypothetical protein